MPHLRNRFLLKSVLDSLAWSPAVGIYGLRQVGKSTLVESVVQKKQALYESFDRAATLAQSQNRPYEFCEQNQLLCIDECQKGPWIFPVIKDIIGTKRKPNRFLLTGSIRFTLKKEIQEALTGRIILFELLPFTFAEANHLTASAYLNTSFETLFNKNLKNPFTDFLESLKKFSSTRKISLKQITRHFALGGMPIPCFSRDEQRRKQWHDGFFETLITRDLSLVDSGLSGILPAQGLSFLRRLSLMQGEELNYSELAGAAGVSLDKGRRLLNALVALCLVDLVVPEKHAAKSQKKMRVEWKDSGLWNYFAGQTNNALSLHDNQVAMELLVSQELRFQAGQTKNLTLRTFYKSHNGASLPWIFRQGKNTVAFIYVPSENPSPYHYRTLKQFVAQEPRSCGIILGAEKTPLMLLDHNLLLMPFTVLF